MALLAAAMLLSACRVASPATRIEDNPGLFRALPAEEQLLVQQGKIREGMSRDAVFLAWGYPNTPPFFGEQGGKRVLRWVYTRPVPVMVTPGSCSYGWCHDIHAAPETAWVPSAAASVTFEDDCVVSWEARP